MPRHPYAVTIPGELSCPRTASGAAAFRRASVPHLRAIKSYFVDALTPEQLETLASVLQALQRHLREEESADRAGDTHADTHAGDIDR